MSTEASTFNVWLKQRRRSLDLTQEDLAERVGCSTVTIQKIELGERRPSKQVAQRLAECLGIPVEEQGDFVSFARGEPGDKLSSAAESEYQHPTPVQSDHPKSNNLPAPLTSLLGRGPLVAEACDYLRQDDVRLLTFTGAPGIGKTRMALQVGAELLPCFEDGVFFIQLAPIYDPTLVASTITGVLGLAESGSGSIQNDLKHFLSGKSMLLVLDNFEQVLDAGPVVIGLLGNCPNLKVLVTSREALHMPGEQQFPIAPLELPHQAHMSDVQTLAACPAIALFLERARASDPTFRLSEDNAHEVAAICARLDGLPLAIELAASRIKILTPHDMLPRLQSRLKVLTGGGRHLPARQQTLRNTIEWSYDLLTAEERKLFSRLAVFAGGCTLEAIEAVCNTHGDLGIDVLDGVQSLVNKSLLNKERGLSAESRFVMLETIHEYAREKSRESEESQPLWREHALYFMKVAEEAEPHLAGAKQLEWLNRLEDEHNNLLYALKWTRGEAAKGNFEAAELGLRIAGALWRFWLVRGYYSEGQEELEAVLTANGQLNEMQGTNIIADLLKKPSAKALYGAAKLAMARGDLAAARSQVEESLVVYRELGDRRGIATALDYLGHVLSMQGDISMVSQLTEEALVIFRQLNDKRGIAAALGGIGYSVLEQGDLVAARALFEEGLAIYRELEDHQGILSSLHSLGTVAQEQEDYDMARSLTDEGLAIARALGNKRGIAQNLNMLGLTKMLEGEHASARSLFEEARGIFRELGASVMIGYLNSNLGHLAILEGDYPAARSLYEASLQLAETSGDRDGVVQCLLGLGAAASGIGQAGKGARLLGASEALGKVIGFHLYRDARMVYEYGIAATRSQLSEEEFESARQEGRAMSMDEAIACALE